MTKHGWEPGWRRNADGQMEQGPALIQDELMKLDTELRAGEEQIPEISRQCYGSGFNGLIGAHLRAFGWRADSRRALVASDQSFQARPASAASLRTCRQYPAWNASPDHRSRLGPAALLLSAFAPWAVIPLMMIGGGFLCFEGVEKLAHKLLHSKAEDDAHNAEIVQATTRPLASSSKRRAMQACRRPRAYR